MKIFCVRHSDITYGYELLNLVCTTALRHVEEFSRHSDWEALWYDIVTSL